MDKFSQKDCNNKYNRETKDSGGFAFQRHTRVYKLFGFDANKRQNKNHYVCPQIIYFKHIIILMI